LLFLRKEPLLLCRKELLLLPGKKPLLFLRKELLLLPGREFYEAGRKDG
jgi:hypothetical protein